MARMKPCVICGKRLAKDATTCSNCDTKDPFYEKRDKIILSGVIGLIFIAYWLFERFTG
ncbi:hypothetical protein TUM4438_31080 [Shewanella sairae]|uniref:DUF2116 family Zn-ribbon domain-containing protein n=1 Tax=Shewanella sairae TaxID=190310 RepID=A0ABQ4PL94_9GAMM|nr:hypothetical protein TUM4438_31080 [Shewanella sairae]